MHSNIWLALLLSCSAALPLFGCGSAEAFDASVPRDVGLNDTAVSDADIALDAHPPQDANEVDAGEVERCTPPCYAWARLLAGPSEEDEIDAVASDAEGNVYVSGKFEQDLTIEGRSGSLENRGSSGADIMVAKYSPSGVLLWVHHFGGVGEDNVFDAACDDEGHLYLSGYFADEVDFDGTVLATGSPNNLDMMVIRMSTDGPGSVDWAISAGGTGTDGANEINVMPNGRIAVLAGSDGPFSIARTSGAPLAFAHVGGEGAVHADGYLLTLDPATGAAEWGIQVGGAGAARAKCLTADPEGNVYFGGDYQGDLEMAGNGAPVALPASSNVDAFISSWTETGEYRWSHAWGGASADLCKGAAAKSDELYLVGYFQGAATFGSDARMLTSTRRDMYAWSLRADGSTRWLEHITSTAALTGGEAVIGPDGGVLFGFRMSADVTLTSATGPAREITRPADGEFPVLVGYSSDGEPTLTLLPAESANANVDEMSLSGRRLYLDVVIFPGTYTFGPDTRSSTGTKDALVVAVDL